MRNLIIILTLFLFMLTSAHAKIIFSSIRDDNQGSNIYVMDDDGSNVVQLTDTSELDPFWLRWSPDGKQIVFDRQVTPKDSQRRHIFIMDADGTNVRQLTPAINGSDSEPIFTPDGKQIVFTRNDRDTKRNTMNSLDLKTNEIEEIFSFFCSLLDVSPDGKQILFLAHRFYNVWAMDSDGGNINELITPPFEGDDKQIMLTNSKWSPDGKKVLYVETHKNRKIFNGKKEFVLAKYLYKIYTPETDVSVTLDIPPNYRCHSVDWAANGAAVIFSATQFEINKPFRFQEEKPYNIYKYHIATQKITRLTNHDGNDYALDWISDNAHAVSPIGKLTTQWAALKSSQ